MIFSFATEALSTRACFLFNTHTAGISKVYFVFAAVAWWLSSQNPFITHYLLT